MSRVELNGAIHNAVAATRQLADDKRIELKLNVPFHAPFATMCEPWSL